MDLLVWFDELGSALEDSSLEKGSVIDSVRLFDTILGGELRAEFDD